MMRNIYIQRFVDKLAGAEARNAKDLILPIQDAKQLHQEITRLLLTLETYHDSALQMASNNAETVEIEITGGSFK